MNATGCNPFQDFYWLSNHIQQDRWWISDVIEFNQRDKYLMGFGFTLYWSTVLYSSTSSNIVNLSERPDRTYCNDIWLINYYRRLVYCQTPTLRVAVSQLERVLYKSQSPPSESPDLVWIGVATTTNIILLVPVIPGHHSFQTTSSLLPGTRELEHCASYYWSHHIWTLHSVVSGFGSASEDNIKQYQGFKIHTNPHIERGLHLFAF